MSSLISASLPERAVTAVIVTPDEMSVPQLVMNCFAPLMTHFPSRWSARVLVAPASDPASGSVSPNDNSLRPAKRYGSHLSFCSLMPHSMIGDYTTHLRASQLRLRPGLYTWSTYHACL